jgi:putative ABC transport system permease protein
VTDATEPSRWRRYLRFARPNVAADVDDELRFHIDMRAERNIALGMAPDEARRDALLRFGDVSIVRDSLVDHDQRKQTATRRVEYLSDLIQDLRFGLRSLRRAPGFTLAATLTLGLGIGANAAIFSFVHGVVLQPLPFTSPHELVSIGMGSGGEFTALRDRLRSFAEIAAYVAQTHPIDDGNEAVRLEGAAVTTNLFPLLGVSPIVGRGFTADESTLGNNGVLLLSHGLWQRRFGGALDIAGKRVLVEGMPHTIVGVMPSDFHFPGKETQYWQPYAFNPANVGLTWAVGGKNFIGRLAPGVTFAQAQREVRDVWPTLRTANPLWDPGPDYRRNVAIAPLQDEMVGTAGRLLWILFACVFVVLLIGCVNVANLLLARATVRERELSVRAALGGGRGRLIRQLVTESVLLSAFGFALGAFLAYFAVGWLVVAMPAGFPRAAEISVNGSVLAFTAAIALLTALLFGVAPAVRATSFAKSAVTAFGRRATLGISHARMSGALVAAQMALAVLLVIAAVLLVRSFSAMRGVEPGFQTTHVIAARITPPGGSYGDPARVSALYTTLVERLDAVPGVQSVAAVDKLPLAQTIWGVAVRIEGQFEDASRLLPDIHHWQMVTPRYFETMGIPLLQGRRFAASDREDQPPVAIVSESFARRFWPDGDAIGRRIGYPYESPWLTIVGVVPDTKQDSLRDTTSMSMYVPWLQRTRMSGSEMWLLARSSSVPQAVAGTIRAIVAEVDRTVPVSDIRTMDAVISDSVQKARFTTLLVGAFALAALLLGAIGIYGVMSYLVGQRSQEMGIRLALGAPAHSVLSLVVRRGVRVAAVGALVGVVAATLATRWLSSLLYGISATDPVTFVAVPLLFVVVASLASLLPALRATRVDPARALRSD